MSVKKIVIASFFILLSGELIGQDTWYGSTSGMRSMFNPAFSGVEGQSKVRISSCSFLPGGGFGLNSMLASVDGFVPQLHGGASLWITNDFLGEVTNDLRGGVTYAYHLKAGENLFFNAGLTASVIHIGIDRDAITFPDDLDPYGGVISPSGEVYSEKGITRFDVGSGFTVASRYWYGGFAVMHLARPYMSDRQQRDNRLSRKYILEGGTEIRVGKGETTLNPAFSLIVQSEWFLANAGVSACMRQLNAGLSFWYIKEGLAAIQPSIGWTGASTSVCLSYSYNPGIRQNTLPPTALFRVSLAFIFKNVEKRSGFHVIKLPEM